MRLTAKRLQALLRLVKAADETATFLDDTIGNTEVWEALNEYTVARAEFEEAWRRKQRRAR